jgi:hypothetical protein
MQPNWSDWYTNLAINDAGNKNMQAYSNTFKSGHLDIEKLCSVAEEIDTIIFCSQCQQEHPNFIPPRISVEQEFVPRTS